MLAIIISAVLAIIFIIAVIIFYRNNGELSNVLLFFASLFLLIAITTGVIVANDVQLRTAHCPVVAVSEIKATVDLMDSDDRYFTILLTSEDGTRLSCRPYLSEFGQLRTGDVVDIHVKTKEGLKYNYTLYSLVVNDTEVDCVEYIKELKN